MAAAGRAIRRMMMVAAFAAATAGTMRAAAQPAPPVRVIAEWEPAVGTLISWPLGIPSELVLELAEDDIIFTLVKNQSAENEARATFLSWGIEPEYMEFIHCNVESIWPRDWGPHQIFDGAGAWSVIDPIFEGYPWVPVDCQPITSPGGHEGDDTVPIDFAAYFGAPLWSMPAYLTGGNFLVDGHAAAFSTCAMVGENQQLWTEEEFLQIAEAWVGVADYHIVNNTEDWGIQHIDCWFKPLDEETLLVKRPPTWHEEYDRIEENLAMLADAQTCYGRSYRIVRIDTPPYDGYNVAAYTNSLILNRKILVPLFNIPGDAQALATFEQAMPGYEVIGFPWGSWYYYDALHCRTRAVFDRHMLRMTHRRLDHEVAFAPEHAVEAMIDDRSEAGLIADELRVYWRLEDETEWSSALLTATGETDMYAGAIPGQPMGTAVEYYLAAADYSGRAETLPRTAPDGFYRFSIIDTSLTIEAVNPPTLMPPGEAVTFDVVIDPGEESLVADSAMLHYRYDGGEYLSDPLLPLGGMLFEAALPPADCDDAPEYYVSAEGSDSGLKTDPPDAPDDVYTAEVGTLVPVDVFSQRFEDGLPSGWSTTGLWHVTDACIVEPPCDGKLWAYYGQDATCDYDTGEAHDGALTSVEIELPGVPPGGEVIMQYCSNLETENEAGYDICGVYANDMQVDAPAESAAWEIREVDLTAFAGETIVLEWRFDTVDDWYNDFRGWQVDAVIITAGEIECEDPCPADVTGDGVVDVLDLLAVLGKWGTCPGCPEDITGDGVVDVLDLLEVLAAWGPCP